MRPPAILLLDRIPSHFVMLRRTRSLRRPVNGLVQMPEIGGLDRGRAPCCWHHEATPEKHAT
ncbi:hypothetical protein BRCON_2021 [Candidatus Sumerlaea chitinivorans]|uniref:Uncharacterized protein n=1 Tax=Sumerlaea chitinivorans TaxID=2250252 RepID=A0A2Z4Y7H4_SUMC1|nr:hypothetical protein BRCON_2021 [Candidatus Sumerlaea chitinivorans]